MSRTCCLSALALLPSSFFFFSYSSCRREKKNKRDDKSSIARLETDVSCESPAVARTAVDCDLYGLMLSFLTLYEWLATGL